MEHRFRYLSLSYETAPLKVRESVALSEDEIRNLLSRIRTSIDSPADLLIVSTCNRTEFYFYGDSTFKELIFSIFCLEKGLQKEEIRPFFTESADGTAALRRLFEVSMGLHSQVVGDIQISNQIKRAYQAAADEQTAGPFLHRLMHTIFFTNKRVVQETGFRDGAASVSYAAVETAEDLLAGVADPKVLVIGLGEIGADVARNLKAAGIQEVTLTNRSPEKAEALAEECGFRAVPFEQAKQEMMLADAVFSCVGMPEPFIRKADLDREDRSVFKFFFDLSVPRSIEPEVEEFPGMILYNVDNINNRANEAVEKRRAAVPQVRAIIEEALLEFADWSTEMVVSPTIRKLKTALDDIRKKEIAKFIGQMDAGESERVERITKAIVQKILTFPVIELKAACKRGEAEDLSEILHDLFNLERQNSEVKH